MPDFPGIRSPPAVVDAGNDAVDAIAESLDTGRPNWPRRSGSAGSAVFD
jgi:hypothetical protein